MMRRKGIGGIADRFGEMSRRRRLLLGGSVVLAVLVLVLVLGLAVLGGGDGSADGSGDGADSDLVVNFDGFEDSEDTVPVDGVPGGAPGMTVAEQVAATVAAMTPPTPTPTAVPTPDIAKTVQAEVAAHRGRAGPSAPVNPLDAGVIRSPQLTEDEKRYFAAMGEDLWVASQMYLRLAEVASLDFSGWSSEYLRERLAFIEGLLESVPQERRDIPREGLSDVVVSYVQFIDGGIRSLRLAVTELRHAVRVFEESGGEYLDEVGPEDRERLRQHYLSANGLLLDFYKVMSAYGCSACGELFRSPFVLEQ